MGISSGEGIGGDSIASGEGIGGAGLEGGGGGGGGGGTPYVMTPGDSGLGRGFTGTGTLDTQVFGTGTIGQWIAVLSADTVDCWFSPSVQVDGATVLEATWEGAPNNPYTLTWNGSRYQQTSAAAPGAGNALYSFLQVGVPINCTLRIVS